MRLALFVLLWLMVHPLMAQNAEKRMDPDVWLSLPVISRALEWSSSKSGAFSSGFRTSAGFMDMAISSLPYRWLRTGDLRIVADAKGQNFSRSHNIGFNVGSYNFSNGSVLMELGGAGFWRDHAMLIRFMEKNREWEWLPNGSGPRFVSMQGTWKDGQKIYTVPNNIGSQEKGLGLRKVWSLDLETRNWSIVGELNEKLAKMMSKKYGGTMESEDYLIWLFRHQSLLIRKKDRMTVLTESLSQPEYLSLRKLQKGEVAFLERTANNHVEFWKLRQNGDERMVLALDLDSVFQALELSGSVMALVTPLRPTADMASEDSTLIGPRSKMVSLVLALVLAMIAGFFGGKRVSLKRETQPAEEARVPEGNGQQKSSLSQGQAKRIMELESLPERTLGTEELNAHIGIQEDSSSEAKRARRAQFIRDINQEYELRYGKSLISRDKDPNDRRRTVYVITPHSSSA